MKYILEIVSAGLDGGLEVGVREKESRNFGFKLGQTWMDDAVYFSEKP